MIFARIFTTWWGYLILDGDACIHLTNHFCWFRICKKVMKPLYSALFRVSCICILNSYLIIDFVCIFMLWKLLKGLFTNFEYITFFSCPNKRNIFCKRSISIKQLWLKIIEKIGCSKSVRPSTVIYIIYITRTDFEHHFSQLFRVRDVLSRWIFHKKYFFCWDTKKMLIIQNWCTIPLSTRNIPSLL